MRQYYGVSANGGGLVNWNFKDVFGRLFGVTKLPSSTHSVGIRDAEGKGLLPESQEGTLKSFMVDGINERFVENELRQQRENRED